MIRMSTPELLSICEGATHPNETRPVRHLTIVAALSIYFRMTKGALLRGKQISCLERSFKTFYF